LDYANGKVVPQDFSKAAFWYRKAAEQGDARAQDDLADMYYNGRGVTQDYTEAAAWCRKAAEQGNAVGQSNLGFMYRRGLGVTQDYTEAAAWYRKAAEQGNAVGQYNLAVAYYYGWGVPKDLSQAALWYRKAAEQGNAGAEEQLDKILKQQGNESLSYWPTTIRVDTDMDSFWLPDEERTCQTHPNDNGRIAVVACNPSGSHRDHNIPVTFWGDPNRDTVSDWKCRREKSIFSDKFVCRAIN
jgi:TPR repeat protein